MDPYQNFKVMSQALFACSQNVPFPGGLALEATARLTLVVTAFMEMEMEEMEMEMEMQAFMEMEETEKQVRDRAERLLQRGVDISILILRHQQELRRDQVSSSFIVRFMSTMAAVDAFVSEIRRAGMERKWIRRYLAAGFAAVFGNEARQEAKQQFDEHWRELDSLHLDFQSHLVSNKAAMGPHQLIKHPDIQVFWKYRLTNALEVPWNYFWDHFLDEYPLLKKIFSGEEGLQMAHAFERLASSRKKEIVSPQEINQVFQPINESVERIVYDCLQIELGSDDPTNLLDIATQGEVQHWKGYWMQDSHKGEMDLELFVTKDHQVFGSGVDEIERFTLEGENISTNVCWKKQYINGHIVNYEGSKIGGSKIQGVWSIGTCNKLLKGDFFLEKNQVKHHLYEPLTLQTWKGFYVQFGHNYDMSTQLVFTHTCKIHGRGFDETGHYTWFGTFELKKGDKEVKLIKQYYQAHSVHYHGTVRKIVSGELVMNGKWSIPYNCKGKFELRTK